MWIDCTADTCFYLFMYLFIQIHPFFLYQQCYIVRDFSSLGISWGAGSSLSKKCRLRVSEMPGSPLGEKNGFVPFHCGPGDEFYRSLLTSHCSFGLLQPHASAHTCHRCTITGTLRTVVYCSKIYSESKNWDSAYFYSFSASVYLSPGIAMWK